MELLESRRLLAGNGPVVLSILRDAANPTNATSVDFRVTFDEVVTGVNSADFVFQTTGSVTSPAVTGVAQTGSGEVYLVSVNTGTGDGTLRLDVTDDNSIVHASNTNKKLGGNQIGDGNFTSGETYSIDKSAPVANNISLIGTPTATTATIEYNVTFSETVSGVDLSDFSITTNGLTGAAINSVTGSDMSYVVQIATGDGEGSVQLVLHDNDSIMDAALNPLGGVGTGTQQTGQLHSVDRLAPDVTSIHRASVSPTSSTTLGFEVLFNEPVTGVDTSDFALSVVGVSGAAIDSISGSGSSYTVAVTHTGGNGTVSLNLVDNNSVVDAAGNALGGTTIGDGDFASQVYQVYTTGSITGHIYLDADEDGFVDASEVSGVVGATVYVDLNDNQAFDTGEPFAITVDSSGHYSIQGVDPGSYSIRIEPPIGWQLSNPAMRGVGTGRLSLVQQLDDNVAGNNFLEEVAGVTESPDGNFVYIAAYADNAITVYSRDHVTGALTRIQTVVNGSGGVQGLIGAQSIAITDDGQNLYVASAIDDALVMFARDESTGLLTYLDHLKQGIGGVDGLDEATAIRQSADGKNLYVAAVTSNSLAVFDRDPATGLVTFAQKLTGATAGSFSVDLSPDQNFVYLSSSLANAINVYSRDLTTGQLTRIQTVTRSTAGYSALNQPWGISLSPDGKHVYVASKLSQGVVVLDRDETTGLVSINQFIPDPYTIANPDPVSVLVSPDGHHVAVTYQTAGGLAIYARAPATGALTLVESYKDGVGGFNDLFGAWDVEFSNDGESLYLVAAYDDAVLAFDRNVGSWLPSSLSATVNAGDTTALQDFAAVNLVPMLDSITHSGAMPVTAGTVDFEVVFSEPVSGVDVSDFTFVGSYGGATASAVTGSGTTYTLTVDLADGSQGTLSPRVNLNGSIVDNEGQPLGGDGTETFDTIDVDRQSPRLLAATKLNSDPTNRTSLQYQLVFSEPVTGLLLSDFSISTDGVVGGSVDSLTGSGDTYVVTMSYTSGEGTLGLLLADNDTVVDVVGRTLDGVGSASISLPMYTIELGTIQGTVFSDVDSDGVQDAGESGIGSLTMFIDADNDGVLDAGEPTATTAAGTGTYTFTGLVDGTYHVRWQGQTPYVQTLPSDGSAQVVPLAVASGVSIANFGVHEILPGSISGRMWHDRNNDGVFDDDDTGIVGLMVYVDFNDNGVFDSAVEPSYLTDADDSGTTTIDESGRYSFAGLQPGDYSIRVDSNQWQFVQSASWDSATSTTYTDTTDFSADNKTLRVSPDGNFVYVFDHLTDNIAVLAVPTTPGGALSQVQVLTDEFTGTSNAIGDIAFTPDGSAMYMIENQSNRLVVFSRNVVDGTLTRVQSLYPPGTYPYSIEVAPDGNHLYVGGGYVAPYTINPVDGTLTAVANSGTPARVQDVVFNRDGTRLYAIDYGNSLMRVYSRNVSTGVITQIQAMDSPIATNFYSIWSAEISNDDRDVYVAAPLTDLVWHFSTLVDGTLAFVEVYDLDTDNIRDLPMDLELSPDGRTLLVALGMNNAIQVLHRNPTDGALTIGPVIGTADPTLTNIYQNSSSLMDLTPDGSLLVRANGRASEVEVYRIPDLPSGSLNFTILEDQATNRDLALTQTVPEVVSVTTATIGPTSEASIDVVVTFDEPVVGVDTSDFAVDATGLTGVSVQSVSGSGSEYTVTLDASAATGQGTVVLRVIDNDSIVDADLLPLDGVGTSANAGQSQELALDYQAPTVTGIVAANAPIVGSTDAMFTVSFSEAVNGVDVGDFAVVMTGGVSGAAIQSVSPGAQGNLFDVVVGSGTGDGTIGLNLIDNDTIIDAVGHVLGDTGTGNGDFTGEVAIVERSPLRTISGTVFNDVNNDGIRDIGENGADGSQIYVDLNNDGDLDSATEPYDWYVTDGAFSFSDLPLGTYTLRVTDRLYYVESPFSTTTVELAFDDNPLVVDVPATPNESAFVGVVFDDQNQNGVRDAGEPGIPNQRVYWDDNFDGRFDSHDTHVFTAGDNPDTPEDEAGTYSLSPLWYRLYQIRVDRGPEWLPTSSQAADATISSPTQVVNASFGLTPNLTSISGTVFDDVDGDGLADAGESPASGWTVFLDADNDGILDPGESSQTTGLDGTFSFDQLSLENHSVRVVDQAGYVITSDDSVLVSITSSTDAATVDFGTHENLTTVSGHMFDDSNADGVADIGEGPIAGATVYLDLNDNARLDLGEPSAVTDTAGDYFFSDVQPGDIVVRVQPPAGYELTTPAQPVDRVFVWHGGNALREVDPMSGATISDYWQSTYPTTLIRADGLAFDGISLWALDRQQEMIFEIDPDAVTIERQINVSSLSPLSQPAGWNGMAVKGPTLYLTAANGDYATVDIASGDVTSTGSVFTTNSGSNFLAGVNELLGLGASPDGQSLVASTDAATLLAIDPVTMTITASDSATTISPLSGVDSVGDSIYVSQSNSSSLLVFDMTGNQTASLPIGCQSYSVAAGTYLDHAARIHVTLDQQVTAVDFGGSPFAGIVTGTQFQDDNGDGVLDAGEQPVAGATVYVDLNNDGARSPSEPFAISAADGSYTIEGVSPGTFNVRAISPANYRANDSVATQDRLFGLRNSSGTLRIDELDRANGSILNSLFTSVPYSSPEIAMAFDGVRFVIIDSYVDMLYEVGLGGDVIDSRQLGEPYINPTNGETEYQTVTDYGPVVIGSTIYTIRQEFGLALYRYDADSNEFTYDRPVTYDWGLEQWPAGYAPTQPQATLGSGVTADGRQILLATGDDRFLRIDPATGFATFDPRPSTLLQTDYAMDSVGSETYVAYPDRIQVFASDGSMSRNLTGLPTYLGLAGGTTRDNTTSVDVVVGQLATATHGHASTLSSISGSIVTDTNENGVADTGETAVVGATVFLDLDRDGVLDGGEPTATTNTAGDYEFSGIAPGEYFIRQVTAVDTIARAWTTEQTRLFQALRRADDNLVVIQEVDPTSGEIVNQFEAPDPGNVAIGLAAKGDRLYYSRSTEVVILDASTGVELDAIPVSNGFIDGLAILGDRLYAQVPGPNQIQVIDIVTRRVVDTLDIGLANGGAPGSFALGFSLAEAPDGVNLAVVPTAGGDVSIVDPQTGVIVDVLPNVYAGHGSASADGEYFQRGVFSGDVQSSIHVLDHLGLMRRSVPVRDAGFLYGLAAASVAASAHQVTLYADQSISGVNFGNLPRTVEVSGTQFVDANQNGSFDSGESPLAGVTIYVDTNANGIVDSGEPNIVSGVDGSYTLSGVPRGPHLIRAIADGYTSTATIESVERLFGSKRVGDGASPTQYALQIFEYDPVSGHKLSVRTTSIPVSVPESMAYDGERLIIVDNGLDKVMQVSTDGTLLGEAALPSSGGSSAFAFGPAVIDGTVYVVLAGGGGPLRLERYDLATNQWYGATPISSNTDQDSWLNPMPNLSASVAESPDGKSLVVFSSAGGDPRAFVIDPVSGRVTDVIHLPETDGYDYQAARIGNELWVLSAASTTQFNVYDSQYNLTRVIQGSDDSWGRGAATHVLSGVRLDTTTGSINNVEIGHRESDTSISGVVSYDANVNGVVDAGEAYAGATVYLDANRNESLDAGELTTTTSADGSYTFSQLPPGDYSVAVDYPATDRVVVGAVETALYALEVSGGVSTISKHDSITGEVLREFPAPGASTNAAGMAVDEYALYYSSFDGVWILDHDTGTVESFVDLPNAPYDGLAALNGRIYVLNSTNDSILRIDPRTGSLLDTFSINLINNTSYDLSGNLGESTDGEHLIIRLPSGGGLLIDPDTGYIDRWYAYNNGAWAIAGAGGELYRSVGGTSIRVQSELEQPIREVPVGYDPRAIAVGLMPASSYRVRAATDVHFSGQDFQIAPSDEYPSTTIRGTVWSDLDRDGVRDAGEPGLPGVTVYIDLNYNAVLDAGDVTQVTLDDDPATTDVDETGTYVFSSLSPGVYEVRQELLPSHLGTAPIDVSIAHDQRYDTDFTFVGFRDHPDDDLRLSATGRYLVYSTTRQVLPQDTNALRDVYLLDQLTNEQELISLSTTGNAANQHSYEPDVSSDGRYVVFRTWASNLDPSDTDNYLDVYVRDRLLGTTKLLTAGFDSGPGNGNSRDAVITPDGRYVALTSWADQLVPFDTNSLSDTFVFDLQNDTVVRVSETAPGAATDASSWGGDITPDGRFVLFESSSSQLVPSDTNAQNDIFLKDLVTGQITLASTSATGIQGNHRSSKRSISDDGRWVVFDSLASNLTADPHPGAGTIYHVFLKDMSTGDITRISNVTSSFAFEGNSRRPEISGDGRFVVFESESSLVPADTNQRIDVYLYDRVEEHVVLVSYGDDGFPGRAASNNPVISSDGSTIAFTTDASNILGPNSVGGIVTVAIEKLLAAHQVTLTSSASSTGNDFGQIHVTGSISGMLWEDENDNGIADAGESPLVGRTVYIDRNNNGVLDLGEPTQVTPDDDPATPGLNEAGSYTFTGLDSGEYNLRQILPSGWTQTFPLQVPAVELLAETDYVHGVNSGAQPIYDSAASDDGRFVAFTTDKAMLPSDTNGLTDLYVIDRATDDLELVSVSSSGVVGDGSSRNVSISGDGRYIVFRTLSSNFSALDQNTTWDIYLRDRLLGTTTLISSRSESPTAGEVVGNSFSYNPQISRDGSVVTFWSNASNLIDGDTNGRFDVFLKDLQTGSIERINVSSGEEQAVGGASHESLPNNNGQLIGFWSYATNLVAGDNNGTNDVFIRDRQSGVTERVSVSATGEEGNAASDHFSMSDDGRFFVFHSNATNLTDDAGLTGSKQIFLKDRQTGSVTFVSKGDAALPDGEAFYPSISADGRWITYQSSASNLVPGDTNGSVDAFLYDRLSGVTTMLSQSASGGASNGPSDWPRMSRDGSTVLFNSAATDLVEQPPSAGALYVYRTTSDDPTVAKITLAAGQTREDVHFGSRSLGVAPTDLTLSQTSINENVDTSAADLLFAQLTAVDEDLGDEHTFELIPGAGDTDNAKFAIAGDTLLLRQNEVVDYETQPHYTVRVRVTDSNGMMLEKTLTLQVNNLVEISKSDVTINDGSAQRSRVDSVTIQFDSDVILQDGAITITKRGSSGGVAGTTIVPISGIASRTFTLTVAGDFAEYGSLVDGNYELRIDASKIVSVDGFGLDSNQDGITGDDFIFGDVEADGFFRFYGDSEGDRDVDYTDYAYFRRTLLKSAGDPSFDSTFDFENDGDVDYTDFAYFRRNLLKTIPF